MMGTRYCHILQQDSCQIPQVGFLVITQVRDKFINNHDKTVDGEWFNGKTAAFKVGNYGIGGFVMVYSLMVKY